VCSSDLYAVSGMRQLLMPLKEEIVGVWQPSLELCWIVTILFSILAIAMAAYVVRRPARGDLR